MLEFHVNKTKMDIYRWQAAHLQLNIVWERQAITVKLPLLNYLRHTRAHPQWAHKARADYLDLISLDLLQYAHTPMDGRKRNEVVNSIPLPSWLHSGVPMPSDRWYRQVDKL